MRKKKQFFIPLKIKEKKAKNKKIYEKAFLLIYHTLNFKFGILIKK